MPRQAVETRGEFSFLCVALAVWLFGGILIVPRQALTSS